MEENNQLTPEEQPEEPTTEEEITQEGSMEVESTRPEETPAPAEMPAHPLVDGKVDLTPTPTPVEDALEESEAKKEPSKFQLFLRKALTWLGVVVAAALVGFLGFYFAFYRPKVAELETLKNDMTTLQSKVEDLTTANADLTAQVGKLENAGFHSTLLDVTTDIYAARLALTNKDTAAAKAALAQTADKLSGIQDNIIAFDAGVYDDLTQRLNLIRSNLDRNPENAIADCDLMLDDLASVETALFP